MNNTKKQIDLSIGCAVTHWALWLTNYSALSPRDAAEPVNIWIAVRGVLIRPCCRKNTCGRLYINVLVESYYDFVSKT